jgi:hypothetical protein
VEEILPGETMVFSWNAVAGATEYHFQAGTGGAGSSNIYSRSTGASTDVFVDKLPLDGKLLYVRIWYRLGSWRYADFVYKSWGYKEMLPEAQKQIQQLDESVQASKDTNKIELLRSMLASIYEALIQLSSKIDKEGN